MTLNGECGKSAVTFYSTSKSKLVPLDVIPSWLRCRNIKSIDLKSAGLSGKENIKVSLYKRL